jgi:regulator of CtrA degradation
MQEQVTAIHNDHEAMRESLQRFINSPLFYRIFDQTIALVQEVSGYLEGAGRVDLVGLDAQASALYQSETVRLSSLLMQISSWLLAQRSFYRGDTEVLGHIALSDVEHPSQESLMTLPLRMVVLGERTRMLHQRIMHLDMQIKFNQAQGVARAMSNTADATHTHTHHSQEV